MPLRKSLKLKNIFARICSIEDASAPHRYTSALYVICRAHRSYFFSGMAPKFGLCPCILCGSLGYQRCLQFAHLFVPYYLKTKPKNHRRHHHHQQNWSFQIRKFSTRPKLKKIRISKTMRMMTEDQLTFCLIGFFLSFSACYDLDMQVHMLDITSSHV